MNQRRLGRTGWTVGEVGLGGGWLLGRNGQLPLEEGVATVHQALEVGVTYVDTAECYIGGKSEEVIGMALKNRAESCVVATKFGHRPNDFDFSRESVLESLQESLRLLRRPSVDIFQLHTPAEPPLESVFGAGKAVEGMLEARERGWCRYLGITGRDIEFLRRCIDSDVFDTLLLFWRYDLLDASGACLFAEAKAHDMGVILGSPLRMGLFGSAREGMFPHLAENGQQLTLALEAFFADEPGGVKAAALRFALTPPEVSVVLSGAGSPEEIKESVALADRSLTLEQVEAVHRIQEEYRQA